MIKLPPLRHGGIMPNYECTAACRHCLYACDPDWDSGYITPEKTHGICQTLRQNGCQSVHIGGGEPFIQFDGLIKMIKIIRARGIAVEYIETNAFWARDEALTLRRLQTLSEAGADTLCISRDSYHAEFIPPALPAKLAETCRRTGFGYFLWETQYNRLRFGGRAVSLEEEHAEKKPLEEILRGAVSGGACKNLTSAHHFHVDLNGYFIPPGCTGIILPLDEAVSGLTPGRYPAFEALYNGGLTALVSLAVGRGFAPDPAGYPSVCAACFHVRKWLSQQPGFPELDASHYVHAGLYLREHIPNEVPNG
jgi:hypothetical protein